MRLQFLLVLAAFLIHTIVDFTIDSVTHVQNTTWLKDVDLEKQACDCVCVFFFWHTGALFF